MMGGGIRSAGPSGFATRVCALKPTCLMDIAALKLWWQVGSNVIDIRKRGRCGESHELCMESTYISVSVRCVV
jgi:hypothetical protein